MYGLPENFDPTGFIGRSVEIVSFTSNTVHLAFDGGYSLTVESSFEHRPNIRGSEPSLFEVPVASSALMRLIGRPVVCAEVEGPGTLCLQFDDGQIFRCFDDSESFESYTMIYDGTQIIV